MQEEETSQSLQWKLLPLYGTVLLEVLVLMKMVVLFTLAKLVRSTVVNKILFGSVFLN